MKKKVLLTVFALIGLLNSSLPAQAAGEPQGHVIVRIVTSRLTGTLPADTNPSQTTYPVQKYGAYFMDTNTAGFATVSSVSSDGKEILDGKNIIADGKNTVHVRTPRFHVSYSGGYSRSAYYHITIIKDGVIYKDQIIQSASGGEEWGFYQCFENGYCQ